MSNNIKRGPGRPKSRSDEPEVEEVIQADEPEEAHGAEVPGVVKALASIFALEPQKKPRNLTRERIAIKYGADKAAGIVK